MENLDIYIKAVGEFLDDEEWANRESSLYPAALAAHAQWITVIAIDAIREVTKAIADGDAPQESIEPAKGKIGELKEKWEKWQQQQSQPQSIFDNKDNREEPIAEMFSRFCKAHGEAKTSTPMLLLTQRATEVVERLLKDNCSLALAFNTWQMVSFLVENFEEIVERERMESEPSEEERLGMAISDLLPRRTVVNLSRGSHEEFLIQRVSHWNPIYVVLSKYGYITDKKEFCNFVEGLDFRENLAAKKPSVSTLQKLDIRYVEDIDKWRLDTSGKNEAKNLDRYKEIAHALVKSMENHNLYKK